jgi:hypothetical protein
VGYQIVGAGEERPVGETVTDDVWAELVAAAAKSGAAFPQLSRLGRGEEMPLDEGTCTMLRAALGNALRGVLANTPVVVEDGESLDRDTVHRVRHVLRHDNVRLTRTPSWR